MLVLKIGQKIGTKKLKEIYCTYVQKTSMIFNHDSFHQKQSFLNFIAQVTFITHLKLECKN